MKLWMEGAVALFRSSLYKTVSAVVRTDDLVLVVDPTWLPHEVDAIREYAESVRDGLPLYVLFTHSDYDHILGYGAFPGARTIASRAFADRSEEEREQTLELIRAFDDDYYVERGYDMTYPEPDHAIAGEGEALRIGGTTLTFYQAPGHNPDGLFTVVEPLGLLLAGDYLSDVEFPFVYYSSTLYEATIGKLDAILARHEIALLVPGHGEETPDAAEMKRRQAKDLAYLRAMREAVAARDQARIDALIDGCPFPRNLRKFHRNNQTLFEREHGTPPTT
ncbi:MBL fold metallo-hydrolase [Paenibacillus sp.]|uniref:MBL fold metallo-hydrolase n=1 Tax=Paenibacillus sp. TaxID=58172 RepID=UPI002D65C1C9|nr:MBL fold metallo-hydrolase [Paenibacillus sp.]HZG87604.1 MBL fold metallo-hydrolase [Paenibacillus sp.]